MLERVLKSFAFQDIDQGGCQRFDIVSHPQEKPGGRESRLRGVAFQLSGIAVFLALWHGFCCSILAEFGPAILPRGKLYMAKMRINNKEIARRSHICQQEG
jgi:hypothetical protein